MSADRVEERLTLLEQKMRRLEKVTGNDTSETRWWERISGAFKDDLIYSEAMKLAQEERQADRGEESAE